MAKHIARDYKNMTVEEMVDCIAADGELQCTYTKDNYKDGALKCSVRGAFVGNDEQ